MLVVKSMYTALALTSRHEAHDLEVIYTYRCSMLGDRGCRLSKRALLVLHRLAKLVMRNGCHDEVQPRQVWRQRRYCCACCRFAQLYSNVLATQGLQVLFCGVCVMRSCPEVAIALGSRVVPTQCTGGILAFLCLASVIEAQEVGRL